jgi:CRISPR-associated protein Cas5t
MYYFSLKAFAATASFRIPEAHTFQQTLPLPPVTTLTGLVGAAVGLDFEEAMRFREENGLRLGVVGIHQGRIKDLWKYQKIKSGEVIPAILLREFLTDLELMLVVGSENKAIVTKTRVHFLHPCYALTAGNSDDLLKIRRVGEIEETTEIPLTDFKNTVIPGDHAGNYESMVDLEDIPLMKTIYPPQVYLLPVAFDFKGEERRVSRRAHFTFIDTPVKLKNSLNGFLIEEEALVLL